MNGTFIEGEDYDKAFNLYMRSGEGNNRKFFEIEFNDKTETVDIFYKGDDEVIHKEYDIDSQIIDELIDIVYKMKGLTKQETL